MEVVAGILGVVLLLWICASESSSKKNGYRKGDLKISRDANGQFYVYEVRTGREIYRADSKADCAAYARDLISG